MLGATQQPIVAIAHGVGFHAHHVRACIRFGQGEQFPLFAANGGEKIPVALFVIACHQQFGRARSPTLQGVAGAPVFPLNQRHRAIAKTAAANLFRQIAGEEAKLFRFRLDLAADFLRDVAKAVNHILMRKHLFFDETTNGADQKVGFVTGCDIH